MAHPDWRCRDGAALARAQDVERLARAFGHELVESAHCRSDLAAVQVALGRLRQAIDEAAELAQHFDCSDLHALDDAT